MADVGAVADDAAVLFCCRRCREPLFRPSHVSAHAVGAHGFSYHRTQKAARAAAGGGAGGGGGGGGAGDACTSFFLTEALRWMERAAADVEGKLLCPRCAVRVGTLAWAGAQCSCGTWVTPALQIVKKAVDERRFDAEAAAAGQGAAGQGAAGQGAAGQGAAGQSAAGQGAAGQGAAGQSAASGVDGGPAGGAAAGGGAADAGAAGGAHADAASNAVGTG